MPEDQVPDDEFIRKLEEYEEVKSKLEEYEVVKRAWRRAVRRLNEEYESRGKSPLADLEDERQLYQLAQTWTASTYVVGDISQHEFALVARTYLLTVDWLLEHLEDLRQHFQGISGEEGGRTPSTSQVALRAKKPLMLDAQILILMKLTDDMELYEDLKRTVAIPENLRSI